jgi:hypothetical protein
MMMSCNLRQVLKWKKMAPPVCLDAAAYSGEARGIKEWRTLHIELVC